MGRAPCCEKMGLKKGPWTPEEDQILVSFIKLNGHSNWRALPKQAGLLRCGKSCRLRWMNYLRPDIKRGNFTKEEEDAIINLHEQLGNRWSVIAARLPGRTDNEIKNVWHTHLKKRLNSYDPQNSKSSNKKGLKPNKSTSRPKSESNNVRSSNESSESEDSKPSAGVQSFSPSSSSISDISSSAPFTNKEGHHGEHNKIIIEDSSFENFDAEIDENFWREALYGDGDHNTGDSTMAAANNLEFNVYDHELGQEFDQLGLIDDLDMALDGYCNDYIENLDEFWYDPFHRTSG